MRFAKLEQPAAEPLDVGLDGFDVIDFEVQARVRQRAFVFLVSGWIDDVHCDFNASEVKLHPAIRLKSGLHVEGAGIECLRAVHVVNIVNHDRAFTMLSFLNTSTGNYSCAPRSRSIVAISSFPPSSAAFRGVWFWKFRIFGLSAPLSKDHFPTSGEPPVKASRRSSRDTQGADRAPQPDRGDSKG